MKTSRSIKSSHWVTWGVLIRWTRKSMSCDENVASEMITTYIEHGSIKRMEKDGKPKYLLPEITFQ
jgi:hypothetical protein